MDVFSIFGSVGFFLITLLVQSLVLAIGVKIVYNECFDLVKGFFLSIVLMVLWIVLLLTLGFSLGLVNLLTGV